MSLEVSFELFFFPFLFFVYFCSVNDSVVCIAFDGYNQFSSALVFVVFESLYRCINAVLNAAQSSYSFFSWHIQSICFISGFLVHWPICLSYSLVHLKNDPEYLTRETALVFIPLIRLLLHNLILSKFLVLILSFIGRLPLLITSMAHFSTPNSIPMSWLYILTRCIIVSSSFSFFFCS